MALNERGADKARCQVRLAQILNSSLLPLYIYIYIFSFPVVALIREGQTPNEPFHLTYETKKKPTTLTSPLVTWTLQRIKMIWIDLRRSGTRRQSDRVDYLYAYTFAEHCCNSQCDCQWSLRWNIWAQSLVPRNSTLSPFRVPSPSQSALRSSKRSFTARIAKKR